MGRSYLIKVRYLTIKGIIETIFDLQLWLNEDKYTLFIELNRNKVRIDIFCELIIITICLNIQVALKKSNITAISLTIPSPTFFRPSCPFPERITQYFQNIRNVVLTLKQLSIRLKECELDIFLRKNRENLPLCSRLSILNGTCPINILREFYVSADDPKLALVFYLLQRNERKYAGDVTLNVLEWEENVIHTTQTKINNSPDKNSRLQFQFYYFKDDSVNDGRSLFLTREKHRQQYNIIQNSNKELNKEKMKLEEEVYHWHKKNEALESGCHDMMINMQERQIYYHNRVGHCQEVINQYTQACSRHREKRQGLMKLAEEHGLTRMQMESE